MNIMNIMNIMKAIYGRTLHTAFAAIGLFAASALTASAHATGGYDLTWHTIDGGGGTSTGSGFVLSGTIGQPDAGTHTGGNFELTGGFWAAGDPTPKPLCPGDLNNDSNVNVSDLLLLLGSWGPCPAPCSADLNGDGTVNVSDLLMLLGVWGPC